MLPIMIEIGAYSFKLILFSVALSFQNVYSFRHSSENGRFERSQKLSANKSRRFKRLLRNFRFVHKLAATLAKSIP